MASHAEAGTSGAGANPAKNPVYKVINDPVHGTIKLHPLLIRIMDTPQFQRLRNIKQLGGTCFVYPGACHTRFEHSIGVAHLAGELARALKEPSNIDDVDVLCVQVAALCHDLGCGPFCSVFNMFTKQLNPQGADTKGETSVKMFDHLVKENGLEPLMRVYGLEDNDLTFIKEMINLEGNYQGRGADKFFLYEIVSNKINGVDVCKFDYFARDCHYLGLQNSVDHHRYIQFARVCKAKDGNTHICMRYKEVDSVSDIFQTSYRLHKRAYQHRVTKAVDLMIKDALLAAKDLRIEGSDTKLCDATSDMKAFTNLTDRVFEQILYSVHPYLKTVKEILQKFTQGLVTYQPEPAEVSLETAKEILKRMMCRDLYKCLGEAQCKDAAQIRQVSGYIKELESSLCQQGFKATHVEVVDITTQIGNKEELQKKLYFYKKDSTNPTATTNPKVSERFLDYFLDPVIRVYYKKADQGGREKAMQAFKKWCNANNFHLLGPDEM